MVGKQRNTGTESSIYSFDVPSSKMKPLLRKMYSYQSFSLKFKVFEDVCKNIANDYVIEMDPESDRKWVKRMTTFEGAMNTDINFQNIMDDKAAEPDKPPSVDVLKIRWTCENILEDVSS